MRPFQLKLSDACQWVTFDARGVTQNALRFPRWTELRSVKPANEPGFDYKRVVQQGYNQCAKQYSAARSQTVLEELEMLEQRLKSPSRLLDLGCGSGVPITQWLAAKH